MKILRITHWPSPNTPVTMGMAEEDMKVSPTEAIEDLLKVGDGFFTHEVFEVEGDDFAVAMVKVAERALDREIHAYERNMAILYHYTRDSLAMTNPNGVVASVRPAPMSRDDAAWVMRCLAHHSAYKNQRILTPLEEGGMVTMVGGEVLPV